MSLSRWMDLEDWRLERASQVLVRLFALCGEERHLQVPCTTSICYLEALS